MTTIQDAVAAANPGDTITIPTGVYDVGDLTLPGNVTLVASQGATIIGTLHLSGPNTTVQGFTFEGGTVDIGNSQGATVRDNVFNGGNAGVIYDGADNAHILNNHFNDIAGNGIHGWGLNQSTISGNQFMNVTQGIDLCFNDDPSQGNNITVDHNQFVNTARMPIEVGPGETARTSNLVISNNWSDNSNLTNQASDGAVAYSIISTYGENTLIEGNYAKGLPGPGIGIELRGGGEIKNNMVDTFEFGIIVYSPGFNVHDNVNVNTPIADVLNYANADGTIQNNTDQPDAAMLAHVSAIDPPVGGTTTDTSHVTDPLAPPADAAPTTGGTTVDTGHVTDPSAPPADTAPTTGGATTDTSQATDPSASSADTAPTTGGATADTSQATDPSAPSADAAPTTGGTTADTSPATDPSASSADAAPTTGGTTADTSHATDPSASSTDAAPTTGGTTADTSHATDPSASSTGAAPTTGGTTTDTSQVTDPSAPVDSTTTDHGYRGWAHNGQGNSAWAHDNHDNGAWAHDAHVGSSDFSGITHQPFEFSGILQHHHDHVG